MIDVNKPYCHIELVTKGGEHRMYDMQFDSAELFEKFDFDKWFFDRWAHEPLFHVPGYSDYLAFDSILKLDHEEYSGIPF